jgi:hypothetical protein
MKKVIFLLLFLPLPAYCQIVEEDFESGNPATWFFSTPGRWAADASAISGKYSLHHIFDNPEAGTDQAGISIRNIHPSEDTTTWSFLVKHGCDPSSSNSWAVLLMSDSGPQKMIPGGGLKGFAVGVNIAGSDDTLRLWKIDESDIFPVVTGNLNWQNDIGINNPARITVSRTPAGEWTMIVSGQAGGAVRASYGSDGQLYGCEWFGIFYRYSSTRDRLFWLDDVKITGSFYEDVIPPAVTSLKIAGRSSLEVTFSEAPAVSSLKNENFTINGKEIKSLMQKTSFVYMVSFEGSFVNKEMNTLQVKNICDEAGNCSGSSIVTFTVVFPEAGDVVITEVMADPSPAVSLPACEYIELSNRTDFSFNLKGWNLETDSRSVIMPECDFPARSHLIVCALSDTGLFRDYGRFAGLKSFPSLNDDGMKISLSDSAGNLIHGIEYRRDWYGYKLKEEGGWSLEIMDEDSPFFEEGNWTASESRKGGTPGKSNSVSVNNADKVFYGLENVFPESPSGIKAIFSEYLPDIKNMSDFSLDNGISIRSILVADRLHKVLVIETDQPLKEGIIYRLNVSSNITDFAGNQISRNVFDFGLPTPAEPKDILFNELLFNPLQGDQDFVEFYNNAEKIIDASRLYVTSVNDATGDTSEIVRVSEEPRCILPHTCYVITTDRGKILQRYITSDPDQIFEITALPAMNDDKGHLVLFNRELDKIDEVLYDDEMHYSLLEATEGISLERVSSGSFSDSRLLWHSASESSGWATPGKVNSTLIGLKTGEDVALSSTKISPDNDGFEDFLSVSFNTGEKGNVLSITIFDEGGSLVRKLVTRLLAGPHEEIIWDGTADDGRLVDAGIYIVFCEMYNVSGKVRRWKKVCTVIR